MSYRISGPDEYLAITGMGIPNVKITKSAWVWPLQRCTRFSVQPTDYSIDLLAMTKEKLKFTLPVVFTIGPDVSSRGADATDGSEDDDTALLKYATLLNPSDNPKDPDRQVKRDHVANVIKGIIEGETRVLVSSMTMEEIFTGREEFKKRIFRNIQSELDQFGLRIWNSNVKELTDAPNSNYFDSLSRKAHEGATNQARIDVAEAQLKGNVGESERRSQQERQIDQIHAETAIQKTARDLERAQAAANLSTHQTALDRDLDIAKVTAQRAIQSTDEDLKKEMEMKRAAAEMERLRATVVVNARIEKETKEKAADASAYEIRAEAAARQEARQREADADAYRVKAEAEAEAVRQLKQAEGLSAMAAAHHKMAEAWGSPGALLQYMMIEKGTYVELAKANANAIHGLEPKISVWNTGSSGAGGAGGAGGNSSDPAEAMRNVYQMLPPLMSTINEQTGITLPEWQFGKMATAQQQQQLLKHEVVAHDDDC